MVPPISWATSPRHIAIHPPHLSIPSNPEVKTSTHHLTLRIPQSPTPAQTAISLAGLDTGTKIGIIVGITVIGILILIGCGLGVLSCRNLRRRRRARDRESNGESMGLEMESKSRKEGGKEFKAIGLWDDLRIVDREREGEGPGEERRGAKVEKERETTNVGQTHA